MSTLPNFLYIGTSKAGSTWIYALLDQHPDVYMSPGKGLYFFDDHYDRGMDWYARHFQGVAQQRVIGEVSHSYLYSTVACRRIAELNPDMRLMVCLREPAERAFSAYLDGIKNGEFELSFEDALEEIPSLVDRSLYATHLQPYLKAFGRDQIHVGIFDELGARPASFAERLFDFLDIQQLPLPPSLLRKRMPAARPRSRTLVSAAKQVSSVGKKLGLKRLKGKLKKSVVVRNVLYRQYTDDDKPTMHPDTRQMLRERFGPEIEKLDSLLGTQFQEIWSYSPQCVA